MINEDYMEKLKARLADLLVKHGVPRTPGDGLEVVDLVDELGCVYVEKNAANKYSAELTEVFREFLRFDGLSRTNHIDYGENGEVYRGNEKRKFEFAVTRKLWHKAERDREYDRELDREFDEEGYLEQKMAKEKEEKRKFWREYLIPVPPPRPNAPSELFLTMAYQPYDDIKNGYVDEEDGQHKFKRIEFRRYTPNWVKRVLSTPPKTVCFQRGYGGPGRPKPEQMVWTVTEVGLYEMDTHRLCRMDDVLEGILPDFVYLKLGERIS